MRDPILLCVDDDPTVLSALRTLLNQQLGKGHIVEVAESGSEALEICVDLRSEGRELSVVVSDFIMPGMRGDELLAKIHQLSPNTVTIMLTGQSELEGIKRAINEANLYRFLEKPFNNEDMVLTVRSAQRAYTQDRELERQNEALRQINTELEEQVAKRTQQLVEKNLELQRLSITDKLTGLYNRLKLDEVLQEEIRLHHRYGTEFSVLLFDVDKFKSVNDTFGHMVGDQVLSEIAQILKLSARETDAVGRWGGEEFLVICRATANVGAVVVAQGLRCKIAEHSFPTVGQKTASIGVATSRANDSIVELLERADRALYRAKQNGRNRVEASL